MKGRFITSQPVGVERRRLFDEVADYQRFLVRLGEVVEQYGCVARAVAAYLLGRWAGMSQRDLGRYMGLGSGSAVWYQMQRLRQRMARDKELAGRGEAISKICSRRHTAHH